ncbi:hypothetical protein JCM11641_008228 [Rhodosporidiobolus odoratus]
MPSLHDTRLLSNLLKTEKDAIQAFKKYTLTASSAGAALSAWSVADSADTGDIMDAALRISQLLSTCTDAQRSYLTSLAVYRGSLKDVLARETALRTVVRDREILVNRLIKLGNKRPKDNGIDEHQAKLDDAQRELRACETFLQEEESALAHAKRRSFRDALATRMRSMGELARVMEESSGQAVALLEQLGTGPEFDDAAFQQQHPHQYEIGSDAGDSIAPSQSASQAMSRASSSSSLNTLDLANAPPLPNSIVIDSSSRPRARSISPVRGAPAAPSAPASGRAKSPLRASTLPAMPAVPSAPPAISSQVYTERVSGMPTFDIPRAPDLSRRPDDSSDDESEPQHEVRSGVSALPATHRSSHYPLDSPGVDRQPARLRRRAASDTSSINEGGRRRKGSFLGGIAALFRRSGGGKNEKRTERQYASEDYFGGGAGGGGGGDGYAGARSRLSTVGGAGANDAVLNSVLNAGRAQPRGRQDDYSSDDDTPRNVVRHVNDPKARMKAMSDVGRSSSPAVSRAVRERRPGLQRKNTNQSRASTVRPMSIAGPIGGGAGEGGEKRKRKVKKAASDIGVSTSGWNSTVPSSQAPHGRITVPKAPVTNGLAPLQGPPSLSATSPAVLNGTSTNGSATPRGEPAPQRAMSESGSVKKTKKKVAREAETVVLSAEALGIPTSAPSSNKTEALSRSGTVKSMASNATVKKKKSRAPSFSAVPEEPRPFLPPATAEALAFTLPTAKSSGSPLDVQLPRPDDQPYSSSAKAAEKVRPVSMPPQAQASVEASSNANPVKTLQNKEKKNKRLSALHGVEGNWVSHPASSSPAAASRAPQGNGSKIVHRSDVHEGDESLLSVVHRADGNDHAQPSRTYGTSLSIPSDPSTNNLPSPSAPLKASLPTAPLAQSSLPVSLSVLPQPPSSNGTPTSGSATPVLGKRKSVRLGEVSDAQPTHSLPSTLSPSNSVRSASTGAAKRGILIQRDASPVPGSAAASLAPKENGAGVWPTRGSIRQQMDDDTSSDEEGGMSAYRAARKMLGRGTREMDAALSGKAKGKARAD